MPYSITREDGIADSTALQDALNVLKASAGWDSPTAARLRELRDSIESQLPKAPVEEPTGDVVVFVAGRPYWPREGGVHWVTVEHNNNPPTWGELVDRIPPRDIEVYRREPATPPTEAVEADEEPWYNTPDGEHRLAAWERELLAEPSPEQVEGEYRCASGCILTNPHEGRACELSAPAEDDPIEALVQESMAKDWLPSDDNGDCLRSFAARVLEVGGQQPGVPVPTVDEIAGVLFGYTYGMPSAIAAASAVVALLPPKEPTA